MRRAILPTVFLMTCMGLVACSSGVQQSSYDAMVAERDQAVAAKESTEKELATVQAEYDAMVAERDQEVAAKESTEKELATVQAEYDAYKEKMKPFEEMTAAQAEAEKAKAAEEKRKIEEEEEARKQAEKEAQEAKEAEEKAEREAKEAAGYETGITYDNLARNPDDYIGEKVKFYGKVVQVLEGDGSVQIRLAVDDNYDTVLLGEYDSSIVGSRVLEGDYITIYGTSVGVITYDTALGSKMTIPGVYIDKIDQ